jgi:hypothetical protein
MTVAASILLAALVGGIVFVLLDSWQRRSQAMMPEPPAEPGPQWAPEPRTQPLWDGRDDDPPPPGLWAGWGR